jgi:hypothetical protein
MHRSGRARTHGRAHRTRDSHESRARRSERRGRPRIGSARGTVRIPRAPRDGAGSFLTRDVRNESRGLRRGRARAESSTQSLCRLRRRRPWGPAQHFQSSFRSGSTGLRLIVHRPIVNRRVQGPAETSRRASFRSRIPGECASPVRDSDQNSVDSLAAASVYGTSHLGASGERGSIALVPNNRRFALGVP